MNTVDIKRLNKLGVVDFIATIKPDKSSSQVKKVMGDNQVTITFEDSRYIAFKINDFCEVFGERYSLVQLPVVTKVSQFLYKYSLIMFADHYDLAKAQYLFLGADNSLRETEFSLMGTASDFISLIMSNVSRVSAGWSIGEVLPTGYKNLTFNADDCYAALVRIAEAFNTEFSFEGKILHLQKKVRDTGHVYKHGRNRGLYEITRQTFNNSNVVTRLYVYGSEKNLPDSYVTAKGKRLRLPGGYNPCFISSLTATLTDNLDGTTTYTFNWTDPLSAGATAVQIECRIVGSGTPWTNFTGAVSSPRSVTVPNGNYEFRFRTFGTTCAGVVTDPVPVPADITVPVLTFLPLPFIDRNTNVYGVIESTEIFDDIYPHRTGKVSSVNLADIYEITDAAMPFDVNAYLLPGLTPKITFNTGQLAGYSFDVQSYDNTFKRFKILKNSDERLLDIPNASMKPAIGDEYVLTDIEMPASYITDAENELKDAAVAKLVELSEPQLSYTIVLDPAFIRRVGRTIRIGDLVWIVDTELEVQKKIRVTSITRNIVEEHQYTVELSDLVSPGTIQRIIASTDANDRNLQQIGSQLNNNSILNGNVIGTLTFSQMPTTTTMTGFDQVVREQATGKLFLKL